MYVCLILRVTPTQSGSNTEKCVYTETPELPRRVQELVPYMTLNKILPRNPAANNHVIIPYPFPKINIYIYMCV